MILKHAVLSGKIPKHNYRKNKFFQIRQKEPLIMVENMKYNEI